MKKFTLILCMTLFAAQAHAAILFKSANGSLVTNSNSASMTLACGQSLPIVITSALNSTASNISGTCTPQVIFDPAGSLGNTTSFNFALPPIISDMNQHFTGAGAITGLSMVYREWFGVSNGDTPIYKNVHDYATAGSTNLLSNSTFTSGTGWALTNFTTGSGAAHTTGSIGTATQNVTITASTAYVVTATVTTTTAGYVDYQMAGSTIIDDQGGYYLPIQSSTVYTFPWISGASQSGSVAFSINTDPVWAGSPTWAGTITSIAMVAVANEASSTIQTNATADTLYSIPYALKFGPYNAGNIAVGDRATGLLGGSITSWNVYQGARSGEANLAAIENTGYGSFALRFNQSPQNTGIGYAALKYNTWGTGLAAGGYKSFTANTQGSRNTGWGYYSAPQNLDGNDNTAIGYQAIYNNIHGNGSTAVGTDAGLNLIGNSNTFVGSYAGQLNSNSVITYNYSNTTSIGSTSVAYGNNSMALGFQANVGAATNQTDNRVQIGNAAVTRFGFGSHTIMWAPAPPNIDTWSVGDRIFNSAAASGQPKGYVCTVAGTSGTLTGVTGSTVITTPTVTVNTATGLQIGQSITIAGVTGIKVINNIVGLTVTIDSNASATVTAAAVAYSAPTWLSEGNL